MFLFLLGTQFSVMYFTDTYHAHVTLVFLSVFLAQDQIIFECSIKEASLTSWLRSVSAA